MNCPVCRKIGLTTITLLPELLANQCPQCQGIWISSTHYWKWLQQHRPDLPQKTLSEEFTPAKDTEHAKVCPECNHILRRYKILPGVHFYIDRCNTCNGMWFDRDEWNVLTAHNLHDNLNLVFTHVWQQKLRAEETHRHLDQLYEQRFGTEDYKRIKEIRAWLLEHPQHAALLAFLQADDPYKR